MNARACEPIRELRRYRTIVAEPQGLAVLGPQILVSFRTSPYIHTLDLATSQLEAWRSTPAIAYGLAASSDRVWAVCGFGPEADRHVFEYDHDGRQVRDPIRCPDGIGSYISYDDGHLYLSQWYNQRVFELGGTAGFVPLLAPKRGICGVDASNGSLTVLTTPDEKSESYFLERYDLSNPHVGGADVATVPFRARSLVWTGSEYLTSHREAGEIVAFSLG
jgi:hypothetical protein